MIRLIGENKNFTLFLVLGLVLSALVIGVFFLYYKEVSVSENLVISSYEECVEAGNPVQESYPSVCTTEDGQTFSQEISEDEAANSEVQVVSPTPNQLIENSVDITGQISGSWLFEATAPVKLYDTNNNLVAEGYIMAEGDWMTSDLVPFKGTLTFEKSESQKGRLVIEKANPSDLEENKKELVVPIYFK